MAFLSTGNYPATFGWGENFHNLKKVGEWHFCQLAIIHPHLVGGEISTILRKSENGISVNWQLSTHIWLGGKFTQS